MQTVLSGGDDTIFVGQYEAFVDLIERKRRDGLFTGLASLAGQEECFLIKFYQRWFFYHDGVFSYTLPSLTCDPETFLQSCGFDFVTQLLTMNWLTWGKLVSD